jgi:hypothetical protein
MEIAHIDEQVYLFELAILSQIELEAKGYGIKSSIANFMNQFSYTLDPTNVLEYSSHGRVFFLLVSKQNLKPSSWCI